VDVVIAGGHGKIAMRLARLLRERGETVRSLIRNPDHSADVEAVGAEPVLFDLEERSAEDLAVVVRGADAVVFTAGAGPGSGPERKRTVDFGGAVKLVDAALSSGVRRYAMVSSIGADAPASGSPEMRPYLEAKHDADEALVRSGLDYTIVRPGYLTDDPGTGKVTAGPDVDRAEIPRQDVAAVLVGVLDESRTVGKTFVVVSGDTPIPSALAQL